VPALATPRLILRTHASADFAEVAAMWADPEVVRHIGGKPFTPEESWRRLLAHGGHWRWPGYGYFAVTDRADGGFLGSGGGRRLPSRDHAAARRPQSRLGVRSRHMGARHRERGLGRTDDLRGRARLGDNGGDRRSH